jgi:hypothetical protein
MTRLFKAEIFKLRKRSMTYILLLILIGFIFLVLSISQATAMNSHSAVTTVDNGVPRIAIAPSRPLTMAFLPRR